MSVHRRNQLRVVRPLASELPLFDKEPWMKQAACGAIDPQYEIFFPEEQDTRNSRRTAATPNELKAKAICSVCPVAWNCLDIAIRNNEVHGIWGGMTFRERCDFTQQHSGHTSPAARAAFRRHLTELNRKKNASANRTKRVRPLR